MFSILTGLADWDDHRRDFCVRNNLHGLMLNWGPGPTEFPCMAASLYQGAIISCFVYAADAKRLLAAAEAAPAVAAGPTRADFDRSVSAHILALVHFCKETGLVKTEQIYLDKYHEFVSKVDQWTAEDHDRLGGTEQTLMRRP